VWLWSLTHPENILMAHQNSSRQKNEMTRF
jgi:hypothetical protein